MAADLATGLRAGRAAEVGRLAAVLADPVRVDELRPTLALPDTGRLAAGRADDGLADVGRAALREADGLDEAPDLVEEPREVAGRAELACEPLREADGREAPFLAGVAELRDDVAELRLRESGRLAPLLFQLPLRAAGLCSECGLCSV